MLHDADDFEPALHDDETPRPFPVGVLVLLEPSCILALIALIPRVMEAPTASTAGALVAVVFAAVTPIALLVASRLRAARA